MLSSVRRVCPRSRRERSCRTVPELAGRWARITHPHGLREGTLGLLSARNVLDGRAVGYGPVCGPAAIATGQGQTREDECESRRPPNGLQVGCRAMAELERAFADLPDALAGDAEPLTIA
jgi:hypothetical protein